MLRAPGRRENYLRIKLIRISAKSGGTVPPVEQRCGTIKRGKASKGELKRDKDYSPKGDCGMK